MKVMNISHGIEYGTEGKKKWTTLGALFIRDDGGMSVKFDYAPPVGEFLNVFEQKKPEKKAPSF